MQTSVTLTKIICVGFYAIDGSQYSALGKTRWQDHLYNPGITSRSYSDQSCIFGLQTKWYYTDPSQMHHEGNFPGGSTVSLTG